ncbi:MAG: hypothetical protein RLZZ196_122 [Bacteroidota bacterium]|jgi:UTP-glucose-1-phosphate uridylyltransferase
MEIIMPAAGLSRRFPNMKPKYLLESGSGKLMYERAVEPFIDTNSITIGILKAHNDLYQVENTIKKTYGNKIAVVVLDKETTGPADTVYQIVSKIGLTEEEILIKDCDSFFNHDYQEGNYICVTSIMQHEILRNLAAKSYIVSNDQGIITSIIEKQVVSDKFCVGGYKFESAILFCDAFEKLKDNHIEEIFVSHCIEECLNNEHIFKESLVRDYVDVGTAEAWLEYIENKK